jgi:polyferredoxin
MNSNIVDQSVLWSIALIMALATAWISKKAAHAQTTIDNAYGIFLLAMMVSMLGSAAYYLLIRTVLSLVEAFISSMAVMTVGVWLLLNHWAKEEEVEEDLDLPGKHIEKAPLEDVRLQKAIRVTRGYVIFLVTMIVSMTEAGFVYLLDPTKTGIEIALGSGFAITTAGIIVIIRDASKKAKPSPLIDQQTLKLVPLSKSTLTKATIISLILVNEFLMGWVFTMASGITAPIGSSSLLSTFAYIVSSYWFIFIMAVEMAFTIYAFRKELPKSLFLLLSLQAVVMFLSPTAIDNKLWISLSVFAGASFMTVLFVFMFEYLARKNSIDSTISNYYLVLLGTYALMMGGLYLWKINGDELLFAISIVLEMAIYFDLILNRITKTTSGAKKKSWLLDAKWTFGVLTTLFAAEFFMGALLDAQINGAQNLIQRASLVSLNGGGFFLQNIGVSIYNFISFFGSVTASPWFLIMMGTEMGALVFFRIWTVREFETKIRLGLVIVAYATYTVALPLFIFPSSTIAKIPFIGWSMGVGTAGAVAPTLLIGLVGTYLVSGVLSFLFGSRQMCSMFCSAALMYQGSFYDSMKTFNRSSSIGKKYLTSKLSGLYKATFSLVWGSLIATVAISYLDSIGALNLSIFGNDPAVFLYTFYFGFLWYIIFFTIPFVGTYACVSMGWCHWGTFNQLVGRLGFFKVKVRDPNVCLKCTTKDCAKACPVGLTDLPSQFISKGEFKSHKCIGVGNCVSSCPFENEYFFDVRNWVKLKLGKKTDGEFKKELPLIGYKPLSIHQSDNSTPE